MNPECFVSSIIMGKAGEKIRPHNMCACVYTQPNQTDTVQECEVY